MIMNNKCEIYFENKTNFSRSFWAADSTKAEILPFFLYFYFQLVNVHLDCICRAHTSFK